MQSKTTLMQTYTTQQGISTYSVSKALIHTIENFCFIDVPRILLIESDQLQSQPNFKIVFYDFNGEETLSSINDYSSPLFRDDLKCIKIAFELKDNSGIYFKMEMRFGKNKDTSDLLLYVIDTYAKERWAAIAKGLFDSIHYSKNTNYILYPPELLELLIGAGGFIGIVMSLSSKLGDLTGSIGGIFFFLSFVYLWVLRKLKGYCQFENNRQKRFDVFFSWLMYGLLGFIIFATILSSVRKQILGF